MRLAAFRLAVILLGAALVAPAHALNLGDASPSYDGVIYVFTYPNGDKPQETGTCPPSGWTAASKGTGDGEICDTSGTWTFSVLGNSASNGFRYAYKDVASGDFQLKARINNDYQPATLGNFAGIGLTISDGTGDSDVSLNAFSPLNWTAGVRVLAGTPGSTTNSNGTPGVGRPRYVCETYDESQTEARVFESSDGSTWLPVAVFDYAFQTPLVGIYGQSGSTTQSITATVDNIELRTGSSAINCYTPEDPPEVGAPTLVSPIGSQSAAENVAFSLSCAANFSGATSYSIAGLPGSTGLSFNTSACALTGTPNGNDVGTRTLTVTASNASGDLEEPFQFTVSAVPGDILTISSGTSTVDCDTFESGGKVDPGDILQIAGGVRGPLVIRDCAGTVAAPIIIRNDVTDNEPAIVRKSSGSSGGFILRFTNVNGVLIDGTGVYTGADSGLPGWDPATQTARKGNRYGLIVDRGNGANRPSAYLKFDGLSCTTAPCTVKGVKVDGSASGGGTNGVCFDVNDHGITQASVGSLWREDMTFERNWAYQCGGTGGGEGFYIGPNLSQDDIQLRDITLRYNIVEDPARDCINVKGVRSGTNVIEYNYMTGCGQTEEDAQNAGIALQFTASWRLNGNVILNPNGNCVSAFFQPQSRGENGTLLVENNIFHGCGGFAGSTLRHGVHITKSGSFTLAGTIRSNTFATVAANGVNASGLTSCSASNNIMAGISGSVTNNCTNTNNATGTVNAQNFADAGGDDFHLTSSSPACGAATSNSPSTDFEGQSRPLDGSYDQGADENAACP